MAEEEREIWTKFCFPSLHVMLGVVNKLCDELKKKWSDFSTWPKALHLCREQYFSKTFEVSYDEVDKI